MGACVYAHMCALACVCICVRVSSARKEFISLLLFSGSRRNSFVEFGDLILCFDRVVTHTCTFFGEVVSPWRFNDSLFSTIVQCEHLCFKQDM